MKRILITTVAAVFLSTTFAAAQTTFDVGFKLGGTRAKFNNDPSYLVFISDRISSFTGNLDLDPDAIIGISGGAFLSINLNGPISIQPEVLYTMKGTETILRFNYNSTDYELTYKINLAYIDIPVLLKYNIPTEGNFKPSIYAGPAVSIKIKGNFRGKEESDGPSELVLGDIDIDNLKSTEFSGVFGASATFAVGSVNLLLDARYTAGFSKIFDDAPVAFSGNKWNFVDANGVADDIKNSAFSVFGGISFPVGGGANGGM